MVTLHGLTLVTARSGYYAGITLLDFSIVIQWISCDHLPDDLRSPNKKIPDVHVVKVLGLAPQGGTTPESLPITAVGLTPFRDMRKNLGSGDPAHRQPTAR